jgi:hypothetical protein
MAEELDAWLTVLRDVTSEPGRVAVLLALIQSGSPLDDMSLASSAGLVHQQLTGEPVEALAMMRHVTVLSEDQLVERDASGFKWQLTPRGTLVSRQWAAVSVTPGGTEPLATEQVRRWRDDLVQVLEDDARLVEQAGVPIEVLVSINSVRLTELQTLNRVLGEVVFPSWLGLALPEDAELDDADTTMEGEER